MFVEVFILEKAAIESWKKQEEEAAAEKVASKKAAYEDEKLGGDIESVLNGLICALCCCPCTLGCSMCIYSCCVKNNAKRLAINGLEDDEEYKDDKQKKIKSVIEKKSKNLRIGKMETAAAKIAKNHLLNGPDK